MTQKHNTLQIPTPRGRMQLSPIPVDDENDELIKAIKQDPIGAGDEEYWDLHDTIDPERLARFWDETVKELGGMEPEDAQG